MEGKIEKIDDRLRFLEIKMAAKTAALEKDAERSARGIKRAETTRISHTQSLANMKPWVERLYHAEEIFPKLEASLKTLRDEINAMREKVNKIGTVNIGKLFVSALSAIIISSIFIPMFENAMKESFKTQGSTPIVYSKGRT